MSSILIGWRRLKKPTTEHLPINMPRIRNRSRIFFVHVVCRTGWQYIYEIVSHKLPFEEAQVFMDNIKQYRFAGWKAVLDHE